MHHEIGQSFRTGNTALTTNLLELCVCVCAAAARAGGGGAEELQKVFLCCDNHNISQLVKHGCGTQSSEGGLGRAGLKHRHAQISQLRATHLPSSSCHHLWIGGSGGWFSWSRRWGVISSQGSGRPTTGCSSDGGVACVGWPHTSPGQLASGAPFTSTVWG